MKVKNIILGIVVLMLAASIANAQCKTLIKKAIPSLTPFTHNGQMNTEVLPEGGVADFKLSCFKGITYRFNVVAEELLGKVTFKVIDEDNEEVYNSKDAATNMWDFAVSSSQDLTVEISVPLSEKSKRGCVALLVGFQPPKKSGGLR